MNLLQLVQTACKEMGLQVPSSASSSLEPQVVQLTALANKIGDDIVTDAEWQGINREYRFSVNFLQRTGTLVQGSALVNVPTSGLSNLFTVEGEGVPPDTQVSAINSPSLLTLNQDALQSGPVSLTFIQTAYNLPVDFQRQINGTHWDKSNHWPLIGPSSPQDWQYFKSGIVQSGPRIRYRFIRDKFVIWPPVNTTSQLGFEYISKYWAQDASGNPKQYMDTDSDACIFADRTMINGIKYEFFSIKGFDTQALARDYFFQKQKEISGDGGAPVLSLSPDSYIPLIGPHSVPDTGYGR
jgi:hypothetical protein